MEMSGTPKFSYAIFYFIFLFPLLLAIPNFSWFLTFFAFWSLADLREHFGSVSFLVHIAKYFGQNGDQGEESLKRPKIHITYIW